MNIDKSWSDIFKNLSKIDTSIRVAALIVFISLLLFLTAINTVPSEQILKVVYIFSGVMILIMASLIVVEIKNKFYDTPVSKDTGVSPWQLLDEIDEKNTFAAIFNIELRELKSMLKVAHEQKRLKLPAVLYPIILSKYQEATPKCIVSAIAVYEQDEKFWPGFWGKRICDSSDEQKTRIFLVKNELQLDSMKNILESHAKKYNVYVACLEALRERSDTPEWFQDFSIIDNKVVAYYNYGEVGDPAIDKKIVFDARPDYASQKLEEFNRILANSQKLTVSDFGRSFEQFKNKLFKTKTEMSRYIDLTSYDAHEPDHPYYQKMHTIMLEEIDKTIVSRNQKHKYRILEIGPGTGIFTRRYAGRKPISIDLVEIDANCYGHITRIAEQCKNINNIFNEDILSWNSQEKKYNIIVSSFSNHHIPYDDTQKFYERIAALLERDGRLIFGEEFIPEHDQTEDGRKRSLYLYHNHIITEALNDGHLQVAELENISLIQGVRREGEYKVSLESAKEEAKRAGLEFTTIHKIGPKDKDNIGGVYVIVATHKKDSATSE